MIEHIIVVLLVVIIASLLLTHAITKEQIVASFKAEIAELKAWFKSRDNNTTPPQA